MIKTKIHTKIYPASNSAKSANPTNSTNLDLDEISHWIGQQYIKAKENKFGKFLSMIKSLFNYPTDNLDPYFNPNFIVIESLPRNQIIKLIEMFIDETKCSWTWNDIAKYIRKYWYDCQIESYVNKIISYLLNLPNTDKYWFFEFLPLLGEAGKEQILYLVSNANLHGKSSELLYGIYLMEPEELRKFYPSFLLAVENSNSFDLWDQYFENYKIIDKLYSNGYNIFTEAKLVEYWEVPLNAHYKILMENKFASSY